MYVFDLGGTLSIVGERKKYLEQNPKDWDSFFNECDQDKVNEPIVKIYTELDYNYKIYIVTGRPERLRKKTMKWFFMNEIPYPDELIMRSDDDHRPDIIVKPELVKSFMNDIDCIFEDRQPFVDKWRELGLCCVQVNDGK